MTRKVLVMSFVVLLLAACSGAPSPAVPSAPTIAAAAPTVAAAAPTVAAVAPTVAAEVPTVVAAAPTVAAAVETAAPVVAPTLEAAATALMEVTPAASGVVTSTAPEEGGIPTIPHPLAGRDNCLLCHVVGGPAEAVPADHAGRTNDTCQGCHKPGAAQPAATPSVPVGDATAGAKLFQTAGCAACHSTEPDKKIVGPSLAGVALDAADSVKEPEYKGQAKDAAGWLQESIVNPNVDVPEGFSPNVMPQDFGKKLTPQQISDLVAYLLTLK